MNPLLALTTLFFALALLASCTSEEGSSGGGQQADPAVVDFPIAYVKRPLPGETDDNGNFTPFIEDLREPISFNPGAVLYVRDRATPSASETDITSQAFAAGELYDVKDVEASYDGSRLLFAMRAPEDPNLDEDEQPTWNIWEYNHDTKVLRRIIVSDITAEEGQDVAPHYLPDGRIVFSSTRQRIARAVLLDEGKPQYSGLDEDRNVEALSLHVMNDDGSGVTQISFNQSHDMDPTVLMNGKIVFSRWDNYSRDLINLYQINPDGTGLEILYGMSSHNTGSVDSNGMVGTVELISPRQVEDGRLIAKLKSDQTISLGGELVFIDWQNFIDINQPTDAASGIGGLGQQSATPFEVRTDDQPSSGGRFASIYPIFDGTDRSLVSWTQCRLSALDANDNPIIVPCTDALLADPNAAEAQPLYAIWMHDPTDGTLKPIVTGTEGVVAHEPVALSPRELPQFIPNIENTAEVDTDLLTENVGIVNIKSVYDFDGVDQSPPRDITVMADPFQTVADERPVRFIRVVKAVSMPDEDEFDLDINSNNAFGAGGEDQLMREILGYTVVHPDGSAQFKVPADVAFSITLLDANGRRVSDRHQNWMSVKAGEVKQCIGCHTPQSELPHGRLDAQAPSVNPGAPVATFSPAFPNTNPDFFADAEGETMAEVYSRLNGNLPASPARDVRDLSVNIVFEDVWTDRNIQVPDADISYSYANLTTPSPTTNACVDDWNGLCRITINYPDHIQPIWDLPRQVDVGGVMENRTCVSCHSRTDAMGQPQQPEAQLELVGDPSVDQPEQVVSYRELFFDDDAIDDTGADILEPVFDANGNPVYEVDQNGDLVLDANDNPIQVMRRIAVNAVMSPGGALFSPLFFRVFDAGGTHEDWLTQAELKLIAEWLDIGAQYYNNPFLVPQ